MTQSGFPTTARRASVGLATIPPGLLPRDCGRVVVRDGRRTVVGVQPDALVVADGPAALERLGTLEPGWWAGYISYDIGRAVEHVTPRPGAVPGSAVPGSAGPGSAGPGSAVPDLVLGRFDARLVIDPGVIDPGVIDPGVIDPGVIDPDGTSTTPSPTVTVEGTGPGRAALEEMAGSLRTEAPSADTAHAPPRPLLSGVPTTSLEREDFENAVRQILEWERAGECYQVNLTRRLTWPVAPDPADLLTALTQGNPAPHGALVDLAGIGVVSASPESFLQWDDGIVQTRPIKGTSHDRAVLATSAKDHAENVMIVDLARNDLGRVCEPGTIHVPDLCALEAHPGLFHLVSTVRGRLADGAGLRDLLTATLPPASVTGAPKPRVLQAIEDLEPVRRGVYCGAVGWIDTANDRGDLNVAIRTFTVHRGMRTAGRPISASGRASSPTATPPPSGTRPN
ncbi:MAG: anthranilate synthase component I family protein [Acidimicrobiia bacterium]|nr:anthranilate synthase component I family protein [Acidimicrobiia bacterium]